MDISKEDFQDMIGVISNSIKLNTERQAMAK